MSLRSATFATVAAAAIASSAAPAQAHHSAAMYDHEKRLTLSGIVKTFSWANPHCWISLMVPNAKGGADQWDLEGGSVSILVRNGWRSTTIAAGDKVKLLMSPRKDGAPGGEFYTVLERNGTPTVLSKAN